MVRTRTRGITETIKLEAWQQPALPRLIQRWLKHLAIHAENCPDALHALPREALDIDNLASQLEQLKVRLEAHEETLRIESAIFDNVKEGIVITDPSGRIVRINKAYSRITGYALDEIRGKRPGDFLRSGKHAPEFYAGMWREIQAHGHWQGEIWNRRKDGQLFLELLTITSVLNEDGEIMHLVGVFGDITDLRRIEHKLALLNHYDSLTNLPNRTLIVEQLTHQIIQANRAERVFGVAHVDLDRFKTINTEFGERIGDQVLLDVANRLHDTMRDGDVVGRLGGDEFVIILSNLGERQNVEHALRRLMTALEAPARVDGRDIALAASIGATVYPSDNADAETLLRHANQAMVEAKQAGGGCFRIFDPSAEESARRQREWTLRLRQGLRGGEMRLVYQPKINLRNGNTIGAEALIRWQHPEQGLLAPAAFLPYAEETELMLELGAWVIDTALAQLERWNAAGLSIGVSVNVAAIQLQQPDFVESLRAALASHPGARPEQVEIEILESSAVRDLEYTLKVLHACRELGIGIALDDFGTGYCSLAYLRQLPATTLKIDQSFVRSMLGKREDLGLIEGIISLAKIFEMDVVAEGLESPEHGVLLLRLGCEKAQGYGIARPMPADDLPDWMRAYAPHPSWDTWANLDWDLSDFPLIVAQYDHIDWVRRILLALEDGAHRLDPAELYDHHHCRLGKWYYGRGRELYGSLDEFRAIEALHREIHSIGPGILDLLTHGEKDKAHAQCMALLELKTRILDLMQSLQTAVAKRSSALRAH